MKNSYLAKLKIEAISLLSVQNFAMDLQPQRVSELSESNETALDSGVKSIRIESGLRR